MDHRETRQFLQIIDEHADHMRHMMGNLSDQRDIETGTLSVNPQPADLEDLVKQARETFLRRGGANTVVIRSGPNLPTAKLDRDRIFRVLSILLTHVSESSPPSSVIEVTLSVMKADAAVKMEISADHAGDWDPGDEPGRYNQTLSPDHPTVMDTRKSFPEGQAICRAIVEAHGGHLSAHGGGPAPGTPFHPHAARREPRRDQYRERDQALPLPPATTEQRTAPGPGHRPRPGITNRHQHHAPGGRLHNRHNREPGQYRAPGGGGNILTSSWWTSPIPGQQDSRSSSA